MDPELPARVKAVETALFFVTAQQQLQGHRSKSAGSGTPAGAAISNVVTSMYVVDVGRLTQLYHAQRRSRRLKCHTWQLREQSSLILIQRCNWPAQPRIKYNYWLLILHLEKLCNFILTLHRGRSPKVKLSTWPS